METGPKKVARPPSLAVAAQIGGCHDPISETVVTCDPPPSDYAHRRLGEEAREQILSRSDEGLLRLIAMNAQGQPVTA
jgi:hypothetical protein